MSLRDSYPEAPDGIRRGFPVETPLGTMYMVPTSWGVLTDNSSNVYPERAGRPVLTYRGREFYATVGIRHDGSVERAYVSKRGSFSANDDAAPTHRAAILDAARAAVEQFTSEHPELIARAKYEAAVIEHERRVSELTQAREALEEAERREREISAERQAARAELNRLGQTP